VEITEETINRARRALLVEKLPATFRMVGEQLGDDELETFVEKVYAPKVKPATPAEVREGVAKHGMNWLKENQHRIAR
jgi:hypothetical protein